MPARKQVFARPVLHLCDYPPQKTNPAGLAPVPLAPVPLAPVPLAPVPPAGRVFSPQLVTADVDLGVQFVKRVIGVDESKI